MTRKTCQVCQDLITDNNCFRLDCKHWVCAPCSVILEIDGHLECTCKHQQDSQEKLHNAKRPRMENFGICCNYEDLGNDCEEVPKSFCPQCRSFFCLPCQEHLHDAEPNVVSALTSFCRYFV